MKKMIIFGLASAITATTTLAIGAETGKKTFTPEERAALKAAALKRRYERTGGDIVAPRKSNRVIALVNKQKDVDAAYIEETATKIKRGLALETVVASARPENAGVVLEICDSDYPATFIVAPESGYAMLNISALKKDSPDSELLKTRTRKEMWRALVYLLGGGNDNTPDCLMKPIASLKELDALGSTCPCPVSIPAATDGAKRFGVEPERRTTYRKAVAEGWAPKPTNDVQRAIWEEVHAKPTNPMKITFDPKKGE